MAVLGLRGASRQLEAREPISQPMGMDVPDNFRAPDNIPVLQSPMSTANRDVMGPDDFGTIQMPIQEEMASPGQPEVDKPATKNKVVTTPNKEARHPHDEAAYGNLSECNCCIGNG